MTIRAFLDANVLASKTQRDWLFKISLTSPGLVSFYSSSRVLKEVAKTFLKRNPSATESAATQLESHLRKLLVDVIASSHISTPVAGIHPADIHVHYAVVASGVATLVTQNTKDFRAIKRPPYQVVTADELLCQLYKGEPTTIQQVLESETNYWGTQLSFGRKVKPLDAALRDANCPVFGEIIRDLAAGPH